MLFPRLFLVETVVFTCICRRHLVEVSLWLVMADYDVFNTFVTSVDFQSLAQAS